MKEVVFVEDERDLFTITYNTFVMSKRTGETIEQLDLALNVLKVLKTICVEKDDNQLVLQEGGGTLTFEEAEYKYFKETLSPPHTKWMHAGLEWYGKLREKFHVSEGRT